MESADTLVKHGVLYPKTGRMDDMGGGHKNIAWRLAQAPEFKIKQGTIDRLLHEIAKFDGTVVISSEDFESVLHRPRPLTEFVRRLSKHGFEVIVVVYLRNQVSYCESIFAQHTRQKVAVSYETYTKQALQRGAVTKGWAKFLFDFNMIVDTVKRSGARLELRNFHAMRDGSVINDFLHLTGIDEAALADRSRERVNERDKLKVLVAKFYKNLTGRPLLDAERVCIRMLCNTIGDAKIVTSPATREAFRTAFQAKNLNICKVFDLSLHGLDFDSIEPDASANQIISFDKLYSDATRQLIADMSHKYEPGHRRPMMNMIRAYLNIPQDIRSSDSKGPAAMHGNPDRSRSANKNANTVPPAH